MGLDPVSWAIMGVSAIGTGIQARSQYKAGKATQKMQEVNAVQQEQDAKDRIAEALAQSGENLREGRRATSKQASQYLHGGVLLEGSPLMVMAETAADFQLESLEAERRGSHEAGLLERGADISRYEGKQARKAGKYGAMGTILQGVSSVGSQYKQMKYFS